MLDSDQQRASLAKGGPIRQILAATPLYRRDGAYAQPCAEDEMPVLSGLLGA